MQPLFAIVLASVTLIGPLSIHLFLPVLPEVRGAFAITDAVAQTTFSVTQFTMAFMTLVYGALSDRFGRRPILLIGIGLFFLGSVLTASAESVGVLIAGRILQGIGAASGVTLARAIARDVFGPDQLVRAIGYLTMAYTLGPTIAPPMAGFLSDTLGWRSVFWFAATAGGLIALATFIVLPETHGAADRTGGSPYRLLGDVRRLFGNLRFTAFVLQSGFSSGAFFAMAAGSAFLMKDHLGRSGTEFGLYFLFYSAGYWLGNLLSTRLSGRVTIEAMVAGGSIMLVGIAALLAGLMLADIVTPLAIFIPGFLLTLSQGMTLPNAQAGAINAVPGLTGTAAGIGMFMQFMGAAIFSLLYGLVSDGTPIPMVATVAISALLSLAAGIVPFLLARRR